ncbi:sialate O-acetylesterase [Oceaniferula spumae]
MIKTLLFPALVLLSLLNVSASIVTSVTEANDATLQGTALSGQPWASQISTTDLVHTGQATFSGPVVHSNTPNFGSAGVNNGGTNVDTSNSTFWNISKLPASVTFNLNTSANTDGYDITAVDVFQGWHANSAMHANQNYKIWVRLVGSTLYTELHTVNYNPFGTGDDPHHYSHTKVTEDDTGIIVSGVDSIRIEFLVPASSGGAAPGIVVNEIDVHGYPTGTTPPSVSLTHPTTRQIIQREADNTAGIPVSGTYSGSADSIEARVVAGDSGTSSDWQTVDISPSDGNFSGTLADIQAGGWYTLEVRKVEGGVSGGVTTLDRVGVGDIYVIAGQSNSANFGSPAITSTEDRVSARLSTTANSWEHASDPLPIANGSGGSPWTRLGDLLVASEDIPIGFISVGQGGTSVQQWVTSLYASRLKPTVESLPVNGFKAVLWHQGESDANSGTSHADYESRLLTIIANSRTDAGWDVPWFLAQVSFHPSTNLTKELRITSAQRDVIHAQTMTRLGARTDDFHLTGKLSDGVHFNGAGLADHAAQWHAILTGTPAPSPINANIESNNSLADGGIHTINIGANNSLSLIGWEVLAASGIAAADGSNGYYNPNATFYSASADTVNGGVLPNMNGKHVAFFSGGSAGNFFQQTFPTSLEPNTTYTLIVALGKRLAGTYGNARLEIVADGQTVAGINVPESSLTADAFTDISVSYTAPEEQTFNQHLAIRIIKTDGTGTYVDFDNVRVTTSLTPFGQWQTTHFGSTSHPDARITSDSDGDQIPNGVEYFLGLQPDVHDTLPVPVADTTTVSYTIPLDPSVNDSGLDLLYSYNLEQWFSANTPDDPAVTSVHGANNWSVTIPYAHTDKAFFQIEAKNINSAP